MELYDHGRVDASGPQDLQAGTKVLSSGNDARSHRNLSGSGGNRLAHIWMQDNAGAWVPYDKKTPLPAGFKHIEKKK